MLRLGLAGIASLAFVTLSGCSNANPSAAADPVSTPSATAAASPVADLGGGPAQSADSLKAAAQRFYDALAGGDATTVRGYFPDGGCDTTRDLMSDAVANGFLDGTVWTVREVDVAGPFGFITDMVMAVPDVDPSPGPVEPDERYSFEFIGGRWMWNCSQSGDHDEEGPSRPGGQEGPDVHGAS